MAIKVERRIYSKSEIKKFISELEKRLIADGFPVSVVILFGSYAKGYAGIDSDIDVAVIFQHPVSSSVKKRISEVYWIAKQVNIKFEPHLLTTEEMKNPYLSLVGEINKLKK